MPFRFIDDVPRYRWTVSPDNLPIAETIVLGGETYVTVCPLCGCAHETRSQNGEAFTPVCLLKSTHKQAYADWLAQYPESISYSSVYLKARSDVEPVAVVKPTRKRSTRKAAA